MQYGLYPWTWSDTEPTRGHRPPDGSVCCLDFRPLSEQARSGQSTGYGLFAWNGQGPPPADMISLGSGDCREIQPTTAQRAEIKAKLGLSANPSGAFLVDAIADVLGSLSDPTGANGPKPLMPGVDGVLELMLANRSRVWSATYNPAMTLAAAPAGRANKIRDVIRQQLQDAFASGGAALVARILGDVLLKHKYTRPEVSTGATAKRGEWVRLLPPGLLAKLGGGSFRPVLPQTTYSENFDGSDGALGKQLSWTAVSGTWSNTGNQAQYDTLVAADYQVARANSDVSSSDHESQCDVTACQDGVTNGQAGVCSRFSPSAATCYTFRVVRYFSPDGLYLDKVVAGTVTNLATASEDSAPSVTMLCRCSGSTISGHKNGTQKTSVTDTSITGNTRGGIGAYRGAGTTISALDNWSITDLSAATGNPWNYYAQQG